jgi:hypothetical protein
VGALAEHFRVYTPERRAHGHTPDMAGPIKFEAMAEDTIASFLETVVGERRMSSGAATVRSSGC